MKMKKCAIIGDKSRKQIYAFSETDGTYANFRENLKKEIIRLITEEGVTHFISGMSLGAELYAAEIVLELKRTFKGITLECAIPFETQAERWSETNRDRYFGIIEKCDKEVMTQKQYSYDCYNNHNHQLIDQAEFIIMVGDNDSMLTECVKKYTLLKGKHLSIVTPKTVTRNKANKAFRSESAACIYHFSVICFM